MRLSSCAIGFGARCWSSREPKTPSRGAHRGAALAEATGGDLVLLEGSGHGPHVRDPVKVNLLLREFVAPARPATWVRGRSRRKRALYISSPIGLGHARRDVAIADELRKLHPDLEIDWLAQHPVTEVLEARGERIHPASRHLANESQHIESESAEHDLHCFQAIRRMDEILLSNFMVFHDLVSEEQYDLWIGDEAWELDYYLHENPDEKRASYVWLTDFVGWLPMPDAGSTRGLPDRRLQRRDDRAHRQVPEASRQGHLRGQPRRHRPRQLRSGPACHPRLDRATTTRFLVTSPGSTPPSSRTGPRCATSWAMATANGSASLPSEDQASVATCFGG